MEQDDDDHDLGKHFNRTFVRTGVWHCSDVTLKSSNINMQKILAKGTSLSCAVPSSGTPQQIVYE